MAVSTELYSIPSGIIPAPNFNVLLTFDNQAHESSATKPRLYWKHHSAVIENRPNRQQRTVQPSANTVNPENHERARSNAIWTRADLAGDLSWIAKTKQSFAILWGRKHCVYQHKKTCGFLGTREKRLRGLCEIPRVDVLYPKEEFCFFKSIPSHNSRASFFLLSKATESFSRMIAFDLGTVFGCDQSRSFSQTHTFRALINWVFSWNATNADAQNILGHCSF